MDMNEISGERQLDFTKKFQYIREAGTEGEVKAAAEIQAELKSFGVKSRLESFDFPAFEMNEVHFEITEPFRQSYTVSGYGRCGCTPEGGVEAPFLYVENGDDISLAYAAGKIVMVNNPVRRDMYEKLVKAGAAGFVSITGSPLDEGVDLVPTAYNLPQMADTPIQGVNLHFKDAEKIVTAGAARARLVVQQTPVTRTSRNVAARIEGSDKADEVLTLTAHYDSVPQGPGAYDNIAGGAIIMELCRYFKSHQPRRSMEFVWFGAEEKGLLGSQNYVEVHKDELPRHQFNMNVDLAGQLVGGTVIGVTGDMAICQMITYMAHEIGLGMTAKSAVWGSDSNTFAWKGVPAMTLNRDGFGMHTRHDTVELLSAWSLKRSASLLGYIAERLGNIETMPFPRAIPSEFLGQLDAYFNR